MAFRVQAPFDPAGSQPQAIAEVSQRLQAGQKHQVVLGVTGSGKTYTMAKIAEAVQRPTLVIAHNKTLAAQLYQEFREFLPENAVEYFVSYYDYYQPEAYIPSSDTFIEKDSSVNEKIDRMRHSATRSLFERRDVLIVASVSCIYGLGSQDFYQEMTIALEVDQEIDMEELAGMLVENQYERNDMDFRRGTFRRRGDILEIFPSYEANRALRIEFFGDTIDRMAFMDPLTGESLEELDQMRVYPNSHYVANREAIERAMEEIRRDLKRQYEHFLTENRLIEAQRIKERVNFDLEMLQEFGYCNGVENYSRYLDGRSPGEPPWTLLSYLPEDALVFVDESHVSIPQVRGMYKGDLSRKQVLVEYGFRLPAALDNRPLNFEEFNACLPQAVYVSATPADYEMQLCDHQPTELIVRPTGLLDPVVEVRPAKGQVDDLLFEVRRTVETGWRVLVTTLTIRLSEHLSSYYAELGIKVKYLHSKIDTLERAEIVRDLRLGVYDVVVGVNLLREGLDIPEVQLVAILDADKEGFLRSERSLVQTAGRAARNQDGRVILYGDRITHSMQRMMDITAERRAIQEAFNHEHGIEPRTIVKEVAQHLAPEQMEDRLDAASVVAEAQEMAPYQIRAEIAKLEARMRKLAEDLEFEEAARLRDKIGEMRRIMERQRGAG